MPARNEPHSIPTSYFLLHTYEMSTAEAILFIVWSFVIGGVIGSFMNVVVYRVPQRISLIEPPSHCPKCKHPIRWHDNVPIFGWLVLRGKCRDCGAPISPRYPAVELVFALMFCVLMTVEFIFQGMNLPRREPMEIAVAMSKDYWYLILLYHLVLLCVLLCGALIEFDRHRPPTKMYVWTILAGLIFPLQWTILRPMKAWPSEPAFFAGGIDGLAGLAAGGTLAYIAWRLQGSKQLGGLPLGLACVGVFLGWQAVLPIAVLAATFGVVAATLIPQKRKERLIPTSVWLWVVTFFWILFWSPLARVINLP
jgi:leader peptidase (prepilin peptidase) / N-methyltransferase